MHFKIKILSQNSNKQHGRGKGRTGMSEILMSVVKFPECIVASIQVQRFVDIEMRNRCVKLP